LEAIGDHIALSHSFSGRLTAKLALPGGSAIRRLDPAKTLPHGPRPIVP